MPGDTHNNLQMVITHLPEDTNYSTAQLNNNGGVPVGGHKQGVMICRELQERDKTQGELTGNSALRSNDYIYWMVMVPKHLTKTTSISGAGMPSSDDEVTPPYVLGEIVYCQRLDIPIVLAKETFATTTLGQAQNHPSVLGGDAAPRWSRTINQTAAIGHYGTNVVPETNMVFWFDLNVDGRSRVPKGSFGTSGTSGGATAQNVWL
jgi:hypothetical protein